MATLSEADRGLDALYRAWSEAFARRDVDAVLELLAEDYVLWMPGRSPLDKAALRPSFEAAFSTYDLLPRFECEERIIEGDLAFERGWDVQTLTPRSGGAATSSRSRVFLVSRQAADGRWRFARGMSQPGP